MIVRKIIKIIIKVLVFITVMFTTAFFVNKLNNVNADKISMEMEAPTLPLVYCYYEDTQINRMQGYTQVMSTCLMRDGIVPIDEQRGVNLLVDDKDQYGATYSYQLRSIAGDSLVEEGELTDYTINQGYQQFYVQFRMDLRENQEYVLVFLVTNEEGETARYYTRVVGVEEEYGKEIIDYVLKFHEGTFLRGMDGSNIVYNMVEEENGVVNNDMSHVTLQSSYKMVTWGGMKPAIITGVVPTITELDNENAVIKLSYVIEDTQSGSRHLYNVEEYYSAKYDKNSNSVRLLAYDRYVESIFDTSYVSKNRNSICLGISDINDVEYVTSDDNFKMAFVKEGQLWYYDYNRSNITNVFSFSTGSYSDLRTLNTNVDINIVKMDDQGNIYFVVYGYMNRGDHEGKNGLSMYYFSAKEFKIQELFFVECDEPFEVMKREVGRFAYYDDEGYFYYILDGAIYKMDMSTGLQDTVMYGLPTDKYMVSENNKIVAYPDTADEGEVTLVNVYNFETNNLYTVTADDGDRLMALGFVGNDLIYGVAKKRDIINTSDGEVTLPFYALYIYSPEGEIIKEYTETGLYIMDVKVMQGKIYLTRAVRLNGFYELSDPDYISYKQDVNDRIIYPSYNYSGTEMNQVELVFPSNIYVSDKNSYNITRNKAHDNYVELKVKSTYDEGVFYVFDNSGYAGQYSSAGRAIVAVTEKGMGLVVDSYGNTIYRNVAAVSYNTVASDIDETPCGTIEDTLMTCAYMCIEYIDSRTEYDSIMQCDSWENAFSQYTVGVGINISGISLDVALYFLDRDVPFAAQIDDGRFVLVISYNSSHIRYYDPILDEEVKVTRKEFVEAMSLHGNTMYTYTSQ